MGSERISIGMLVTPEMDAKAAAKVIKDAADLHKRLAKVKLDFKEVAKRSSISIAEIKNVSAAAEHFSGALNKGTVTTIKRLSGLVKKLEDASEEAEALQDAFAKAKDETTRSALQGPLGAAMKSVRSLTDQVEKFSKANSKQINAAKQTLKIQDKFRKNLASAADYTGRDAVKDIAKSIGKGMSGGTQGVRSAMAGVGGHAVKAAQGHLAKKALAADAGGSAAVAGALGKAAGALGGAVVALGAMWEFIKAASDHQAKLNKALLEGLGTANDLTASTARYADAVNELREASMDSAKGLLKFGGNSETAARAVNAFAKETTGSITKAKDAMESLGGKGKLKKGAEEFTKTALIYGKALGMETSEAAGMMGRWTAEVGYGTDQIQDLMKDVVGMAATSNMPVAKFMDIFRQTVPNVELFTNRIEELAGTIKLLSKTMSPQDVRKFMDAFGKGFKGQSFKERLGHTLVAGVGKTNEILKKDFAAKAGVLNESIAGYKEAFDSGDRDEMNKVLAQARASGKASPAQIGEAQKLFESEKERQKGGPLSVASALKGGSMRTMIKLMGAEMKTFGMGGRITGINEQVAEKRGYSRDQIDAMNQLISSMDLYQSTLKDYGTTGSKSMDEALKKILTRDKQDGQPVTKKDMEKATDDQIMEAAELAQINKKIALKAEDIAVKHMSLTTSISDKIDNVIAYFLEKMYRSLSGILDTLNELLDLTMDPEKYKKAARELATKNLAAGVKDVKDYSAGQKAQYDIRLDALRKAVASGVKDSDLSKVMAKTFSPGQLKNTSGLIGTYAAKQGMGEDDINKMTAAYQAKIDKGDVEGALTELQKIPGSWEDLLKTLNMVSVQNNSGALSDEAKRLAQDRTATRRPEAGKAPKIVDSLEKLNKDDSPDDNVRDLEGVWGKNKGAPAGGPAGPPIPGQPVDAKVDKTVQSKAAAAGQEMLEGQKAAKEAAAEGVEVGKTIYGGVDDVLSILKKGIKFEQSWMGTRYKVVLKEATLDAFRPALLEFAILQAKLEKNSGLKDALVKHGSDLVDAGKSAKDVISFQDGDAENFITKQVLGQRASGGPIPETGLYGLHAGEHVLAANEVKAGGGGKSNVYANITINGSSLSQSQLEGAVYGAMDRLARRA